MIDIHEETQVGKYRIGTVTQLTGLSADTIRMWERRYGTITPSRTDGGTRLYSDEEVARLQLMRALTETGDSIGAIARLSTPALRERLARLADLSGRVDGGEEVDGATATHALSVLGTALHEQLRVNAADLGALEIAAAAGSPDDLLEALPPAGSDILVAAIEALGDAPLEALRLVRERAGSRLVLVVYDYAPRRLLTRLTAAGAKLVRGPISVASLRRTILDHLMIRAADTRAGFAPIAPLVTPGLATFEPPPRTFSDEQLARLREMRSAVDCECPNHLASIVSSLVAFERYSTGCESKDREDSALHEMLARGTAEARAAIEKLLVRVCRQDGIDV